MFENKESFIEPNLVKNPTRNRFSIMENLESRPRSSTILKPIERIQEKLTIIHGRILKIQGKIMKILVKITISKRTRNKSDIFYLDNSLFDFLSGYPFFVF